MSVYVDELMPSQVRALLSCSTTVNWGNTESCRLCADTVSELHNFAIIIGLLRSSFRHDPRLPHYDLYSYGRDLAVARGAIEMTGRQLGALMAAQYITANNRQPEPIDLEMMRARRDELLADEIIDPAAMLRFIRRDVLKLMDELERARLRIDELTRHWAEEAEPK